MLLYFPIEMNELFSDLEDLAQALIDQDSKMVEAALEIVFLQGKLEGYGDSNSSHNGQLQKKILSLNHQIEMLMADFADQILGYS